ncbi:hypothetical protein GOBAR_DD29085 [Gossypium barbadense]|nr:hypothetical protein GOBAR_DD29085 [Gossypium barbadense]
MSYYRFDNVDDAFNLFNKMIQRYPKPSIVEFTKLLAAIVRMKHYAIAVSMCSQMELLGVSWDVYSLSILVNCFCKISQAVRLFDEMVENGYQPNLICKTGNTDRAVSTVIDGLCKKGSLNETLHLFSQMKVKSIRPDIVSYNILIDAHCKDGKIFEATDTVDTMKKQGIEPDVVIYWLMRMVSEAKDVVGTMIKQGIEPDVTYNILVVAHCREGMVSETEDIVDAMIKHNIEPNVVAYSALINGHCLQNKMDKARKVFQLMIKKGCAPDIFSYNIMINGYYKAQRIDEAMELFHEISQKGPNPDIATFNTLMQCMCKLGRVSSACELLRKMIAFGQVPNALELFQAMRNSKLELDTVFGKELFHKLSVNGLKPSVYTFYND